MYLLFVVCSIGFEANDQHTTHLTTLQESYRTNGLPCVIFTDTAVSTYDGTIDFYYDSYSPKKMNQWGASALNYQKRAKVIVALALDIDKFIHDMLLVWKSSTIYYPKKNNINNLIVTKMDIEGSEFSVLPHMNTKGSLCHMNLMLIEWHVKYFNTSDKPAMRRIKKDIVKRAKDKRQCLLELVDLDDEVGHPVYVYICVYCVSMCLHDVYTVYVCACSVCIDILCTKLYTSFLSIYTLYICLSVVCE